MRLGYPAAEDDAFGIEQVDQIADPDAEIESHVLEYLYRLRVTLVGSLKNRFRQDVFQLAAGQGEYS